MKRKLEGKKERINASTGKQETTTHGGSRENRQHLKAAPSQPAWESAKRESGRVSHKKTQITRKVLHKFQLW